MKKNIRIFSIVVILSLLFVGKQSSAQSLSDNGIFYHSFSSPWSASLNPALFPTSASWYITLPRTNFELSLPFSYSELGLRYDKTQQVTYFNVTDFIKLLNTRHCRFSMTTDANILGLGFSIGRRLHFTLDAGVKSNGLVSVPIEITRLLTEGNLTEDKQLELGTSPLADFMAYGYASAGMSYNLSSIPLTLGVRFNMLDGIVLASVDNLTLNLITPPDTSSLKLIADYTAHSAGMAYARVDSNGNFAVDTDFSFPMNLGYTVDFGAKFSIPGFDFSVSLLNFGTGIRWTQNPNVITPKNGKVTIDFDGIDLDHITSTEKLQSYADSLLHLAEFSSKNSSFYYAPPTKLYVGASFSLLRTLRIGYLFHGEWEGGLFNDFSSSPFRFNNTISLHLNVLDWLELSIANSVSKSRDLFVPFNPGFSISFNPSRTMQLYAAVDYTNAFSVTKMRAAHVYFGINIYGYRNPHNQYDD